MFGETVKIVRNSESFWVLIVRGTRNKMYAIVDNDVIMQPFAFVSKVLMR